LKIKMKF